MRASANPKRKHAKGASKMPSPPLSAHKGEQPGPASNDLVTIDYARLKVISGVVQLQDVSLIGANLRSFIDPRKIQADAPANGPEFFIGINDARWWREGTLLEIVLGYDVMAALRREADQPDGPRLFQLGATWVVTYELPKTFHRPDNHDEIAADFVIANGQVNVFPFLRQLVVDLTAKAGWLPLILPVFRVPRQRPRGVVRNAPAWDVSNAAQP